MIEVFYTCLRFVVKLIPFTGQLLSRWRPENDHFRRFAQYARAQRILDGNVHVFRNRNFHKSTSSIDISVIITSFNYAKFIREAIISALEQQKPNIELVIVDDNSSDNSCEVIRHCINDSSTSCTLLELDTNGGLSHARNIGLKYARAAYVFILDADNIIAPNGLDSLFQAVNENHATAAFGRLKVVDEQLDDLGSFKSSRLPSFSDFKDNNQLDAMALYKTSYLRETSGFDVEMLLHGWGNEDWELWARIFSDPKKKVQFVHEVVGLYRAKAGSMVSDAIRSHDANAKYIQKKYFA